MLSITELCVGLSVAWAAMLLLFAGGRVGINVGLSVGLLGLMDEWMRLKWTFMTVVA